MVLMHFASIDHAYTGRSDFVDEVQQLFPQPRVHPEMIGRVELWAADLRRGARIALSAANELLRLRRDSDGQGWR